MCQNTVSEALKEIEGEGTTTEFLDHISEPFSNSTLSNYAVNRLRQLAEKNVVEIDAGSIPFYVRIIDQNWNRIRDSLADREFPSGSTDAQ